MKTSLLVIFALVAGIFSGKLGLFKPAGDPAIAEILLYVLLFFIALNLGLSSKKLKTHMRLSYHDVLVPVLVAAGSLAGAWAASLVMNGRYNALEVMAVGSGFGYYSLSSILIMEISGNELAMLALIANLFREMATLVFSPIFARLLGRLAPVASGGATAMDTTLPVIVKSSGKAYAVTALISGMVLTFLVPFIIPFILSFNK